MPQKRIIVTGIGGNVGQGILRNIHASPYDTFVIGTNVDSFSGGNHLCDAFYKVPYAYEDNYLHAILNIVAKEKVDLIIPATDYEVFYLASFKDQIPCAVAVSDLDTARIYLDKYKTFQFFKAHEIPFAEAYLPSAYDHSFRNCIAKPREGRGSRGLVHNPVDFSEYSDEAYMIQDLIIGKEITTAFYVTKDNTLHGHITFVRSLENGATQLCRVTQSYDEAMESIIKKMISATRIRGAANVQSIVNDKGAIIPFEINCRISGTNSIRSQFGFRDVEYTLAEYLFDEIPKPPVIQPGSAARILMDVIYKGTQEYSQLTDKNNAHYLY
ncbi:ATP-grasp domain-containing protein [Altibacter sp. HG106]|uniref:ATP-grasp domain-containing protein n=1 Tax=Altibacter sp. HG106 TaxID=3023937 RepID=UPI0023504D1E|nr:ATP-grasp domain-containing protein [Altibacter sp. HG106]MDC7995701.1 ATP-grasp domain-containing protein [Altibacter sp. HG106]